MQIDDLTAGLSLSFLINLNTEQLQFESKILEVYPRRHTLLAQGVFTDDKIISFRGKGLVVDLIVTLPEDKPQLFKNVTTNVVKLSDGTLCYTVSSIAGSKTYNRRQSYLNHDMPVILKGETLLIVSEAFTKPNRQHYK